MNINFRTKLIFHCLSRLNFTAWHRRAWSTGWCEVNNGNAMFTEEEKLNYANFFRFAFRIDCFLLSNYYRFLFTFTLDRQRHSFNSNTDIHLDWSMVRNLLSTALQATTGTCNHLDCAYLDGRAAVWFAGIFRSASQSEPTTIRRSAICTMCRNLGCQRGDALSHHQSYLSVYVSELSYLACIAGNSLIFFHLTTLSMFLEYLFSYFFVFAGSRSAWWQSLTAKLWGCFGGRIRFPDTVILKPRRLAVVEVNFYDSRGALMNYSRTFIFFNRVRSLISIFIKKTFFSIW